MRRMLFGAAFALLAMAAWREPSHAIGYGLHGAAGSLPAQVKVTMQHLSTIYNQFGEAGKTLAE